MDFYTITTKVKSKSRSKDEPDHVIIYPEFNYISEDIATKGGSFYAYWDGSLWNTSFGSLIRHIDNTMFKMKNDLDAENPMTKHSVLSLNKHGTQQMTLFLKFLKQRDRDDTTFNTKILFSEDEVKREDYVTRVLEYTPKHGSTENFNELLGTLYHEDELTKILWFIGALLTGEMHKIQKFLFLYGGKGTGKGTIINVIKWLFEGYYSSISLRNLTGQSEFATAEVQELPLLIDEDCDISSIANDTNLLKITAHEPVLVNQKHKETYFSTFNGLLIAASNERFKVKHVDSGITRRAVVAEPSKKIVARDRYEYLMNQIKYEIPHIAQLAIDTYNELGRSYFDSYVDVQTMEETDYMYAFIKEYKDQLGDPCTLLSASNLYKQYLLDMDFNIEGYRRKLKKALNRYYDQCLADTKIDGVRSKNVYKGFKHHLFESSVGSISEESQGWITLTEQTSLFDGLYSDASAQYANQHGTPTKPWDTCDTYLKELDTTQLHYVRVPEQHIVIDFDCRDENGEKSLEESLRAANKFPKTYTEVSKSGQGVHLHYIYEGDVTKLSSIYDYHIEIKVYLGKSSLRRKLTKCNNEPVAHISTGLPLKEENDRMYESIEDIVWTERKIRTAIQRNLRKEYHPNTRPSIDFIVKILDDAAAAGLKYDVSDLLQEISIFAMRSTNQSDYCLKAIQKMKFTNGLEEEQVFELEESKVVRKEDLWFYDVEVYPNLFLVCAKKYGVDEWIILVNPTRFEVEDACRKPLVGFNNLRYDNHIMMGAITGEDNVQLFQRSQAIINNEPGGMHSGAYGLSYLDIYEMATKKQSLKKWEVEMGIDHMEMDIPWDEPVPEELIPKIIEYCKTDVIATEAVFKDRGSDYDARLILSELSGLPVNAKTQDHTAEIIFEGDRYAKSQFVYTDLATEFPGYTYEFGKSSYLGEDPSEGGLVREKLGVHNNVVLLDIESMHPKSIEMLNFFGKYTKNFVALLEARLAIKHKDYDKASRMFNGKLKPYLKEPAKAKALSYALKIAINIVYGMTSAKFPNKFNMPENKDNIVAKRGALFMLALKQQLDIRDIEWCHFKTDSVKLVDPSEDDIEFVKEFGKQYGYTFAHEATYSRMALVTKADYIAQYAWSDEGDEKIGQWEVVGARFADPVVYKKIFSKEEMTEEDYFLTKTATAPIYLGEEFIGKVAKVYCSNSGQELVRVDHSKEVEKRGAVSGTKNYEWELASRFKGLKDINMDYYGKKVEAALDIIAKVGRVSDIVDDIPSAFHKTDYDLPF